MVANTTVSIFPAFIASWLQLFAPGECFDELFVDFNIFHVACLKVFVSKCLGYAIIVGSGIVKVPQIIKLIRAKSGEGISLLSVSLELFAISAAWAYGSGYKYPFSAYGEAIFLAIQTTAIAFLVLMYSGQLTTGLLYTSAYVGAMGFLLSPAVPLKVLAVMQGTNMIFVSVSKAIQAFTNYQNGSTGQLSVITVYMIFLGALARIFTSIQETGDFMVIATYCVSSLFNGIIAAQMIIYWNVVPKPDSTDKKKISETYKVTLVSSADGPIQL